VALAASEKHICRSAWQFTRPLGEVGSQRGKEARARARKEKMRARPSCSVTRSPRSLQLSLSNESNPNARKQGRSRHKVIRLGRRRHILTFRSFLLSTTLFDFQVIESLHCTESLPLSYPPRCALLGDCLPTKLLTSKRLIYRICP
jgi:hypothetical protein